MSVATYGVLYPKFVSLADTVSQQGVGILTKGYKWGIVDAVNYANFRTDVGARVIFREQDAALITAGGVQYYIVDENDLIFKEFNLV